MAKFQFDEAAHAKVSIPSKSHLGNEITPGCISSYPIITRRAVIYLPYPRYLPLFPINFETKSCLPPNPEIPIH